MSDEAPRGKAPAFQWYPGDHKRDTALQACSFEARALWREMLDLMHDGEPRGHLAAGGVAIEPEQLARLVGMPNVKVRRWLKELESRKVFSRTAEGIIYSRRMTRDEHITQVRRAAGSRGGNPNLLKQRPAGNPNLLKQNGKQNPTPAVAVASASATADAKSGSGNTTAVRRSNGRTAAASARAAPAAPRVSQREKRTETDPAGAYVPADPAAELAPQVGPGARRWFQVHYGAATLDRQWDVARQLIAALSPNGVKLKRGHQVRAGSSDRLDAKCREMLEEPPLGDRDRAVVVLLKKLGDTSDNSAPGQVAEVAAVREREVDHRKRAEELEVAITWLEAQPADISGPIINDPELPARSDVGYNVMLRAKVLQKWRAAGSPGANGTTPKHAEA